MGLLGWMTNFIVGMSYHLLPGFVVGARSAAGLPLLSVAELSPPRARAFVFFSLNLGLLVLAAGLLAGEAWIASAAGDSVRNRRSPLRARFGADTVLCVAPPVP